MEKHGYEKLEEHDRLMVDDGKFAEEDDKEKEWPELPSWYVRELEADKCLGEGVKDYEICSG